VCVCVCVCVEADDIPTRTTKYTQRFHTFVLNSPSVDDGDTVILCCPAGPRIRTIIDPVAYGYMHHEGARIHARDTGDREIVIQTPQMETGGSGWRARE
jgi:hypothetical protein